MRLFLGTEGALSITPQVRRALSCLIFVTRIQRLADVFLFYHRLFLPFFRHRTFTHSLLFLIIVNASLIFLFPDYEALRRGLLIGMASHYLLVALSVRGIRFFYPADVRVLLVQQDRASAS